MSVAGSGTAGLAARGYVLLPVLSCKIDSFGKDRPSAHMTLRGSSKSDVELHSFSFSFLAFSKVYRKECGDMLCDGNQKVNACLTSHAQASTWPVVGLGQVICLAGQVIMASWASARVIHAGLPVLVPVRWNSLYFIQDPRVGILYRVDILDV